MSDTATATAEVLTAEVRMPARPGTVLPPGTTMTVYRYAISGDLPDVAVDELRRAHVLRNKLTEVELAYQDAVAAAWAAHPEIAAAQERLGAAGDLVAELLEKAKAHRQRERGTRPDTGITTALKDARMIRKAAKEEIRGLKDRYYAGEVKPAILAASQARKEAVKAAYPEAIAGGLYWATFNDTAEHHAVSVAQVAAKRRSGQPAQVRFRRWTGEGTLAVQLQRQAGEPARTPELIASGEGKWRNVATLGPWRDPAAFGAMPRGERRAAARGGTLTFRIGSGERAAQVTVPVVVHRMLPADADITGMRITRRILAGKPQCSVSVTARVPAAPERAEGPLVAVHSGWRAMGDGSLRVAVISGAGPVPADLAGAVRAHGGWAEVIVPASWRDVQANGEKVRSRRDQSLDALRARMLAWLAAHPEHRDAIDPDGTLARWKSPARFAALAIRLREQVPDGGAELAGFLESWRKQDKHLWTWEANERDQLTGRRDETWRRAAAWITSAAAVVVMDEWDVAPLARRPDVSEEDDPQSRAARANRVLAAPAGLRAAIRNAAAGRGVAVAEADMGPAVHHACGTPLDAAARMESVMVWCGHPGCQVMVDQDRNALLLLEAAARGETGT